MDGINLYGIEYYEKTVFKGSFHGICFRIGKKEIKTDDDTDDTEKRSVVNGDKPDDDKNPQIVKTLLARVWKGPYILEKTDEKVYDKEFDFTDKGLLDADRWIEQLSHEISKDT